MYRRFMDLFKKDEHAGISIFYNAKIDNNGIFTAIQDFTRSNGTEALKKIGESKSIIYLGEDVKFRDDLKGLATSMGWKTALKFVRYKKQSCKQVLAIGKAAGDK